MAKPGDLVWPLITHDSGYNRGVINKVVSLPMEPFGWGVAGYSGGTPVEDPANGWNAWSLSIGSEVTGSFTIHPDNKILTLTRTGTTGFYGLSRTTNWDINYLGGSTHCGVVWVKVLAADAGAYLRVGIRGFNIGGGGSITTEKDIALDAVAKGEWLAIPFIGGTAFNLQNSNRTGDTTRYVALYNGAARVEIYEPAYDLGRTTAVGKGSGSLLQASAGSHSVTPIEGALSFWMQAPVTTAYTLAVPVCTIGTARSFNSTAGGGAYLRVTYTPSTGVLSAVIGLTATTQVTLNDTIPTVDANGVAINYNVKLYWKSGDKFYMKINDRTPVEASYTTTHSVWAEGGPVTLLQNPQFSVSDSVYCQKAPAGQVVMDPGFSFTRASTAMSNRLNSAENAFFAVDVPVTSGAYTFSKSDGYSYNSIKIEEGTTNLLPAGRENFSTGWQGYSGSTATVSTYNFSPWGTGAAYRITTSGGSDTLKWFTGLAVPPNGQPYSISVWARTVSGTANVGFNVGSPVALTTTWTRVNGSFVSGGVAAAQLRFQAVTAGDNVDVYVTRPQIEYTWYGTNYHPCGTTRAPVVLTYNPALGKNKYNNGSGSVIMTFVTDGKLNNTLSESAVFFEIGDSTGSGDYIKMYKDAADQKLTTEYRNAGGTVKTIKSAAAVTFSSSLNTVSITWRGNSFTSYINAAGAGSGTLDAAFSSIDTEVARIGCSAQGTNYANVDLIAFNVSPFVVDANYLANFTSGVNTSAISSSLAGNPIQVSNLFLGGVGWTMEDLNRAYYNKMMWYDPNDYSLVVV
jgi:hypothetical protein